MTQSTPVPVATPAPPPAAAPRAHPEVEIRPLRTIAECDACVEVQRHVWGWDEADVVPATLLHVVEYVGGLAAGAFDAAGTLVGFVFGVSGVRDGELVHWSHMLGVRESARNLGLGRMLKEHQRDVLAARGIRRIFWSFDPLMAKNAYFNVNRLGASVVDYVADMYGTTASPLHLGLPTDRLVVTTSADAAPPPSRLRDDGLPIVSAFLRPGDPTTRLNDHGPDALLVEIPTDVLALTRQSVATARAWRLAVREQLQWALANGYRVVSVRRDAAADRAFYVLAQPTLTTDA